MMVYATIIRKPRRLKAALWCLLCLGFGYPNLAAQASLEATSGIQMEAGGGIQVEVKGNWLNQGSLLPGLSTLRFDGATGQAMRNQGGSFYNVTVDKAAGEVTAMGHFNIDGAFTLSSGDVNLNGNVIILGSNALLAETPGHTVKGSSGYLLTTPAAGQPALVGADASHAWVQVWAPDTAGVPADGWLDLDPTNDLVPATDHVRLAVGRDYADVAPLRGVIRGGGAHTLAVGVHTRRIADPAAPALVTQNDPTDGTGVAVALAGQEPSR